MRKSIDEKGELGFEDGQMDGKTYACMHARTNGQTMLVVQSILRLKIEFLGNPTSVILQNILGCSHNGPSHPIYTIQEVATLLWPIVIRIPRGRGQNMSQVAEKTIKNLKSRKYFLH